MAIRAAKGEIQDLIPVRKAVISVFDKTGLEDLIRCFADIAQPHIVVFSSGGTYAEIERIVARTYPDWRDHVQVRACDISKYTGFPEMEGGLVKTLHPKIHAGILAERNNSEHNAYLEKINACYIDMVVVNLYPFQNVVAQENVSFETARGHIDIGGPTMLRAAAKNFLGCSAVCDPQDYKSVLAHLRENNGCTTFEFRRRLAEKVFEITSGYDKAILGYFSQRANDPAVMDEYGFKDCLTNKLGL